MSNRLPRLMAVLALAGASGCAGKQWHVLAVPPDSLAEWPGEARLTLNDGTRLVVTSPKVRRDSVFGQGEVGPVALPLSQVSRIAVEGPNPEKPGAIKVLLVTAGLTIISIVTLTLLTD